VDGPSDVLGDAASFEIMNKKQNSKCMIIPTSGAEAFAELHDEIAAVGDDLLVPISVDISFAHQIALAAADRVDELMPELAKLPALDFDRIRKLRIYAAACQHAHVLATSAREDDPRLRRLLDEGAKLRQDLLSTAELLVHFGEVSEDRMAAVRGGQGHVEMAKSLEQLGVLFEEIWERVVRRIPVTAEMVERAPGLALEINVLLGARMMAKGSEAQSMRQRAFTLLVMAYDECRSAVEYLRRREGDAVSFTPSLFVKKRRRGSAVEAEEPVTDAPEAPVPALAPTPTPTPTLSSPTPVLVTELEPTG
jgi:hypothetical protein